MRVAHLARVACFGLVIDAALVMADTRSLGALQPAQTKPVALRVADTSQVQVIRLRDGSSIVGRVTKIGTDTVQFATSSGPLAIPRADIVVHSDRHDGYRHIPVQDDSQAVLKLIFFNVQGRQFECF